MDGPSASPEIVAEIDRLAAAAQAAPDDMAAMDRLWRAIYGLDRWLFLARGERENPRPYMLDFPQGPMVLAFTTAERAQAAGRANGLSEEEVALVLAVPLPGGIEWAASLPVSGVVFDYGVTGVSAPVGNLIPMRDWMASRPAPPES